MPRPESTTPDSFTAPGDLLRHLRVRARLSQRDLAVAVGYSEAHISRLEQGQRLLDPAVVAARFVPALGLDGQPDWAARLLALAGGLRQAIPGSAPPMAAPAPADPLLLATKLHRPAPRQGAVERPRLHRLLARAPEVPLTLVVAPAGFGKSSMLAGWLSSVERGAQSVERQGGEGAAPAARSTSGPLRSAWLTLEAAENDLASFLRYLTAALRVIHPPVGGATLAMLQAAQLAPLPDLLTPLLNELTSLPEESLLVLDDYHAISSPDVHAALGLMLARLPHRLHLVIASRAEPPLPLARLRARAQLVELRAADLRFDPAEAAAFMRDTMSLALSDSEAAALDQRTEGWAAGLQLAALAMRAAPDRAGFIAAFAGANHYVLDYLVEEVLDRLPAHLRHFLLQTGLLDRLCGELCDALLGLEPDEGACGEAYSQLTIAELERRGLFLIPLDDERRWYRYHHLFAEALRERLAAGTSPEALAELHRRASVWLHAHDLADEALHHALCARDEAHLSELAADLLERGLSRSDPRVKRWRAALPPDLPRQHARLALQCADVLSRLRQYEEAVDLLDGAPALRAPGVGPAIVAGADLLRARVARLSANFPQAQRWIAQAAAQAPADDELLQARLLVERGVITAWSLDPTGGIALMAEAERRCRSLGLYDDAQFVRTNHLRELGLRGRLRDVLAMTAEERRTALARGVPASLREAVLLLLPAEALVNRDQLDEAAALLTICLPLAVTTLEKQSASAGCWSRARVALAREGGAAALASLDESERQLPPLKGLAGVTYRFAAARAQVYLWLGDPEAARPWVAKLGFDPEAPPALNKAQAARLHAGLLLAEGRGEPEGPQLRAAAAMLGRYIALAEAVGRAQQMLSLLLMLALVRAAMGDGAAALTALGRALAIAATEGYLRNFVEEGEPMAALLEEAQEAGVHPAYVGRILAAFPAGGVRRGG